VAPSSRGARSGGGDGGLTGVRWQWWLRPHGGPGLVAVMVASRGSGGSGGLASGGSGLMELWWWRWLCRVPVAMAASCQAGAASWGGGVSSGGGRAGEVTPFSRGPKFGGGGGCGTLGESGGAGTSDGMAMVGPEL
jgi:hypothetical protein